MKKLLYALLIILCFCTSCSENDNQTKKQSKIIEKYVPKGSIIFEDGGCEYGATPHIDTFIKKSDTIVQIKLDVICIENVNVYDTSIGFNGRGDSEVYVYRQRDSYLNLSFRINEVTKNIRIYKSAFIDSIRARLAKNGTFRYCDEIKFDPSDSSISVTTMIMYTGTDAGSRIHYKINWEGIVKIFSVETADEFGA